jgi:hypothetical protein
MRIKVHIMQYVRVKASVLGMSSNILIEDALIKLLKKTRNMSKLDAYRLIRSPVKMRRIPITTTIQDRVLSEARELAKKLDVLFAEVVEVAIAETIYRDAEKMRAGKLPKILELALEEFLNIELKHMQKTLPGIENRLKTAIQNNKKSL